MKLVVLFALIASKNVHGSIDCKSAQAPPPGPDDPIFTLGDPALFVTTSSQKYDPYSLVDTHRRTSVLEEFLMVGYHRHEEGFAESVHMVLYDGVKGLDAKASAKPDLVYQNLEKELYWRYFNTTGIYPSMTIVNATTRVSLQFHSSDTHPDNPNNVAFMTWISARKLYLEPQVPYTTVFEIPANSRVLRKHKTMVEYQSFSLWRWRLSPVVKKWTEITSISDEYKNNTLVSNFHRIDNPCIKDMFFMPRSSKAADEKLVYLASPLIQAHLDESWFYDMKTKEHPWWPEAPDTIVLTNDHLVVITLTSMWVSNSLNDSGNPNVDLEMTGDYTSRPDLTYAMSNPCGNYRDTIDCFFPENTIPNQNTTTKHRLFYLPICYLYQFPNYDDFVIFTIERTRNGTGGYNGTVTDFSVLYAAKPYMNWRVLFTNVAYFKMFSKPEMGLHVKAMHTSHAVIESIVGIFFNYHKRHFDITLRLQKSAERNERYVRFILPEPTVTFDGYGELLSRIQMDKVGLPHEVVIRQLNGTMGKGFSEFYFLDDFEMEDVVVNPNTLDVFFLGNQFWIAEAGGPSVYASLSGLSAVDYSACTDLSFKEPRIKECSFNHPDKVYICMNQNRRLVLTGKIGSKYTPSVIKTESIQELVMAQKVNPWEATYTCELIQKMSLLVSGYSGNMLFWYWHEPDAESTAVKNKIQQTCDPNDPTDQPVLCEDLTKWKQDSCTSEPSGKPGFRMVAIKPSQLLPRNLNTDGPLAPFLVDSNTALLYEGIIPDQQGKTYDYLSEVFVGQKIFCTNYNLLKADANDKYLQHTCELFIRHIKPLESYLDGLRRCLYVNIVKSIPMFPLPADIVVLIHSRSNKAYIAVDDYVHQPPVFTFTEDHIGQTLYIPGNFSVLLSGFPIQTNNTIIEGYTTKHFQHELRLVFRAYHVFLMDMSTQTYRAAQSSLQSNKTQDTKERWNRVTQEKLEALTTTNKIRSEIEKRWGDSEFAPKDASNNIIPVYQAPPLSPSSVIPREDEELELLRLDDHLKIGSFTWTNGSGPNSSDLVHGTVDYEKRLIWYVAESECHYVMSLVNNPVLKTSGGRISLDLYDRISFEVLLRPLTPLGKLLMYRPLIVVTNSNPNVLRVEMVEKLKGNPQFIQFLLSPTGYTKGVATITVRTRVSSLLCPSSTSVTLFVLCHRDVGRRLHVGYPIPTCKPSEEKGMYSRPWFNEMEGCISSDELLDPDRKEIYRYRSSRKLLAYVSLPVNYRPPSFDGPDIPQSKNVYNADPSKPAYKAWYQISKETIQLNRCAGKSTKSECACSPVDRLMDDEELTECKEKVFAVKRTGTGEPIAISVTYDRIMRDKDQNPELFLPKTNWSVTIEEVNGRGEWYITSEHTPYIRMINTEPELHRGRRYYDMNKFKVTLLGTGLFHFKIKLGRFESFDPVTGHFILYASTDDINHVHLFMILLGTIIFCMTMVLVGFLVNRKRLSSMLPIQPMSHKRKLKLL